MATIFYPLSIFDFNCWKKTWKSIVCLNFNFSNKTFYTMDIGFYVLILVVLLLIGSYVTVQQGSLAVVTVFGKYKRLMRPGLNFRIPIIEQIFRRISTQNRSIEIHFDVCDVDRGHQKICGTGQRKCNLFGWFDWRDAKNDERNDGDGHVRQKINKSKKFVNIIKWCRFFKYWINFGPDL